MKLTINLTPPPGYMFTGEFRKPELGDEYFSQITGEAVTVTTACESKAFILKPEYEVISKRDMENLPGRPADEDTPIGYRWTSKDSQGRKLVWTKWGVPDPEARRANVIGETFEDPATLNDLKEMGNVGDRLPVIYLTSQEVAAIADPRKTDTRELHILGGHTLLAQRIGNLGQRRWKRVIMVATPTPVVPMKPDVAQLVSELKRLKESLRRVEILLGKALDS